MDRGPSLDELLDRADAARLTGRGADAARLYEQAMDLGRARGDLAGRERAVLGAAALQVFGTEPGRLAAELHDVLARTTDDAARARLAAALARCWAYAGHPARAGVFADQALEHAERAAEPALLADALDGALAARWGPDDLDARRLLAARLGEVVAHALDPEARLRSHLWSLQVACETLDLPAAHRHVRALERLGRETARARFFAASRRLMLELLEGRTDRVGELVGAAESAGRAAGLADAWMVVEAMRGYAALQDGDTTTCARVAAACQRFALEEGATELCAEAAYLWAGAGRPEEAGALVDLLTDDVLDALPRDVNWLLTLQCTLEAALVAGRTGVVEHAATLLAPYEGRAVVNAGAVMFHGVTDDPLSRAAALTGGTERAARLRASALATYRRVGATWWHDRLRATGDDATPGIWTLRPTTDGLWLVGPAQTPTVVRGLRGYAYLRTLLGRPGTTVRALDLVTGGHDDVVQPGLGPVLDRRALAAYRRRLAELDDELDDAARRADLGRESAARDEREALLAQLRTATGLGGRPRSGSGSSDERARVAATKAIGAAVAHLAAVEPALGDHLRRSIRTGGACSYAPDARDLVTWVLD